MFNDPRLEKAFSTLCKQSNNKPLPCPFCGNKTIDYYDEPHEDFFYCEPCGLCGPRGKGEADALVKWNQLARLESGNAAVEYLLDKLVTNSVCPEKEMTCIAQYRNGTCLECWKMELVRRGKD